DTAADTVPAARDCCCEKGGKKLRQRGRARGILEEKKKTLAMRPTAMGMVEERKPRAAAGCSRLHVLIRRVFPSRKTSRSGEFFHTHLIRVSASNTQQYTAEHGRASKSQHRQFGPLTTSPIVVDERPSAPRTAQDALADMPRHPPTHHLRLAHQR